MIRLLQDALLGSAETRPDATAVVMGDERLTYGELEELSNRLAHVLRGAGCGHGDRVTLFVPKCPRAIVGMLAALKADCAYVPIDIASPAARVELIMRAAEPRVVLATRESVQLLDELIASGGLPADVAIGSLEDEPLAGERFASTFSLADAARQPAERPPSSAGPADLAHILFTSGSTGTPKGVMIKHENVAHYVDWAVAYFGTEPGDRVSGHPPLHFDLSTFDIYATFLAGAELHLVPPEVNLLPQKLAQWIRDSELTQWFAVPSIFTYMAKFDVVDYGDFPTLKRVLWCGEVLPTPILIHWMQRLPHASFTNLYGPTEATIASSYYTVTEIPRIETDAIPIGRACTGEELLILDEELRPAPAGEIGDLFIGGVGLSPGYWRDEEKTGAAFIRDPRSAERRIYRTGDLAQLGEDGLFYFLGRADSQIKHRGYRIELGEIETAVNAVPSVQECAVVGVETGGFEGTAICCAYAPTEGAELEPAALREALRKVLPGYMLPSRWLTLERLPKNVNGKIDRKSIRDQFERGAEQAERSRVAS